MTLISETSSHHAPPSRTLALAYATSQLPHNPETSLPFTPKVSIGDTPHTVCVYTCVCACIVHAVLPPVFKILCGPLTTPPPSVLSTLLYVYGTHVYGTHVYGTHVYGTHYLCMAHSIYVYDTL